MITHLQNIMRQNPQVWTVNAILTQNYGAVLLADAERACLKVADFYFIEGPFSEPFGKEFAKRVTTPAIITSSNHDWYEYYKTMQPATEKVIRSMYIWSGKTERHASYLSVNPLFFIKPILQEEAAQIQQLEWAEGVFDSYDGIAGFLKNGFGFCVLDKDKIVSLCMSFSHSEYGVEIEVDTDPAYQGQGLGKAVSAHFIAESLRRGITPLWDATNIASANIAKAIGFDFQDDYQSLYCKETG